MAERTSQSGGIGFCGLLTIVFIVLQLTGYISWSWWLVLAPLWLPLLIGIGVLLFLAIILAIIVAVLDR